MGIVEIILIVAASVIGVAAIVYGFFRRASRVSWIGWQVFLLFALTFLLDVIPVPEGMLGFGVTVGVFVFALCADLLLGGIIRSCIMKCSNPPKYAVWLSRVSGALCCLLNIALLFLSLASAAFAVIYVLPSYPAAFASFFGSALWQNFLSRHIYDLFIITLCFVFTRAGLRLGVVRGLYYLLMLALTFVSFFGAVALVVKVPVFESWGSALGGKFEGLGLLPSAASFLGHGVFVLVFFIVMFAVSMLLGALAHWGLRRLISCRPLGLVSAILLFILFLVVFFGAMCGIYFGVHFLTVGQFAESAIGSAAQLAERLLTSSRLSAIFYYSNPLLLILH